MRIPVFLMAAVLAACGRATKPLSLGTAPGDFHEGEVTAVITSALEGEATGAATDTLYVSSALIVVNGRIQAGSPRFAGIGQGGQIVITSSQLEIRPNSSWSAVDYRWESGGGETREGRATLVLAQIEPGRWKIQHVHSSSPQ